MAEERLSVLLLCTGNSARSQMAEALLRRPTIRHVITVCDRAADSCPVFPGDPERMHWSFEDPAAVVDAEERRHAFEQTAAGLVGRLRIWMPCRTSHAV